VVLRGLLAAANRKKSSVARALVFLAITLFSSVGWMAALDPAHRITQYGHTAWRIQDGYFAGQPWSITQTTDGYLWVGTAAGVLRFDGVQFVPLSSLAGEPLPSEDVRVVFGARDGSLWIGTMSGLVHWVNPALDQVPEWRDHKCRLTGREGANLGHESTSRRSHTASTLPDCRY
jgi:ligand-binding sensor domain-containing protein